MNNIQRLYMVVEQRKQLEREEKLLKASIKQALEELGDTSVRMILPYIESGGYVAHLVDGKTCSCNWVAMELDHGREFCDKYRNITKYKKVVVEKHERKQ
jgi:hypothetical protein